MGVGLIVRLWAVVDGRVAHSAADGGGGGLHVGDLLRERGRSEQLGTRAGASGRRACGLTLVAFGLEQPPGHDSAMRMLLWQSLVLAVLFVLDASQQQSSRRRSDWPVLAVVLCLASGLWGRQAVLNRIVEQAWPTRVVASVDAESVVFGSTESRVWWLVIGLACVSELLTSFSLLRVVP